MAKTWKPCTMNEEQLEVLAQKFGKLPKEVKSGKQLPDYFSQEELDNLPYCKRTSPMESGTRWCSIGGRNTYPFITILTPEEHKIYSDYHKGTASGNRSSSAGNRNLDKEKVKNVREALVAAGVPEDVLAKYDALTAPRNTLFEKMFGVSSVSQLTGKVNLAYIMFRTLDGKFADELQPDMVTLVQNGYVPAFTIPEIKKNLEQFEKQGIILKNTIIDYDQYIK